MKIDPNSRGFRGLVDFISFVGLNILYIVTCLPIVTIGAATSALYEVTMRYADDERGKLVMDYLPTLGRNFRRATTLMAVTLLPASMMLFSAVFWSQNPSPIGGAASILAGLATAYLVVAFMIAMALVATYENTFRQTLRNAMMLPIAEPLRCAAVLLIPLTMVGMMLIMNSFAIIVGTIGFSVGAYATAYIFRSIFARHTPE